MKRPHDNCADYYDLVFSDIDRKNTERTLEAIKSILPDGGSIIDFGAGTGRISIPLAKSGFTVTAVEQSKEMVRVMTAKSIQQDVSLNIEQCPISQFTGKPADLAISLCGVMNYVLSENDLINCFRSFERSILPNGLLVIDFLVEDSFDDPGIPPDPEAGFIREVIVAKDKGDVYNYSEVCKLNLDGVEFYYKDEFKLKKWTGDFISNMLYNFGFCLIKELSEFGPQDYTCLLYQKKI